MAAPDPQEVQAEEQTSDRQTCQGDALALRIHDEIILCLRMEATAPLLKQAHKILDAILAQLCPGVKRKELVEEDPTGQVVPFIRGHGLWQNESFAFKVSTGPTAPLGQRGACAMGPNQCHRRRVASLALAATLICSTLAIGREWRRKGSFVACNLTRARLVPSAWRSLPPVPDTPAQPRAPGGAQEADVQYIFGCHVGLLPLTRLCRAHLDAPLPCDAPRVSEPTRPPVLPTTPTPAPSGKELLQHRARSLGADEKVLEDPYLSVQEPSRSVLCAACDKYLTFAHIQSKKHQLYLENIEGTLRWLQRKRPDRVCLKLLERNPTLFSNHGDTSDTNHGTTSSTSTTAASLSTASSTPLHPSTADPSNDATTARTATTETGDDGDLDPVVDLVLGSSVASERAPGEKSEGPGDPSSRCNKFPPDLPSAEEICDFLVRVSRIKEGRLPRQHPILPERGGTGTDGVENRVENEGRRASDDENVEAVPEALPIVQVAQISKVAQVAPQPPENQGGEDSGQEIGESENASVEAERWLSSETWSNGETSLAREDLAESGCDPNFALDCLD